MMPMLAGCAGSDVEPLPDAVLVQFVRSGGIEGAWERLTIEADGSFRYETRSGSVAGRLAPAELEALEGHIAEGDYTRDTRRAPDPAPTDWLTHTCRIRRGEETVRIRTDSGPIATLIDGIRVRAEPPAS
jgi:hypothetical protein